MMTKKFISTSLILFIGVMLLTVDADFKSKDDSSNTINIVQELAIAKGDPDGKAGIR